MLYALLPQSCHGLSYGDVSGPQMVNIIAATCKRFISIEREGMFSEMLESAIETLSKVLDPNGSSRDCK